MLLLSIGIMLGGALGVFVMYLVTVGKEGDYHFEDAEYEIIEEKADRTENKDRCPK